MNISDIPNVDRILTREFKAHRAPVVDLISAGTGDSFKILIATILSARTKDETTAGACARLFAKVHTPHDFDKLSHKELERLIFPVGFYHTKALHLKQLPEALDRLYGGKIPQTIDELCELPGVGRKTANLVMARAFNLPAICVDVHVHRICNRTGLIKTKDPFETEMKLREILPKRFWIDWNSHVVSFGQMTCTPVSPKCDICPISRYCKRIGVKPRKTKQEVSHRAHRGL